ncbi:ATP-binding protein [Thermopolyspora sp. NPDC052614]|uniref:ATP-binding protein n=1 Tax=Thermopolyspora sp. NPDC052614 TaxID=3155682 RepID=UPI003431C71B
MTDRQDGHEETVGDRLRRARQSTFVGRDAEKSAFLNEAVLAAEPRRHVLHYYGVGGIGKSSLLDELAAIARARQGVVGMAVADRVTSPIDLIRAWRAHLPAKPFRRLDAHLRSYDEIAARVRPVAAPLLRGTLKAAEAATGPLGAFVSGAIGEERLRNFLSQVLSGKEATAFLHGPRVITDEFLDGLARAGRIQRIFLFIDFYEVITSESDRWIREALVERMPTTTVLITAGREPLHAVDALWSDYARVIGQWELQPLSPREIGHYLDRVGVLDRQVRHALATFTGGHPWALELTVEAAALQAGEHAPIKDIGGLAYVRSRVAQRFLRELDDKDALLREIVEVASLLSSFDEDILRHLVGSDVRGHLEELSRYSFLAFHDDQKPALKDMVREVIEEEFRRRSGRRWAEARARAAEYYRRRCMDLEPMSLEWRRPFHEWLVHTAAVDPPRALDLFEETVRPFPVRVWAAHCGATFEVIEAAPRTADDPRVKLYRGQLAYAANDLATAHRTLSAVIRARGGSPGLRLSAYSGIIDLDHRRGSVQAAIENALSALDLAVREGFEDYAALFAAKAAEMYGVAGSRPKVLAYSSIARTHLSRVSEPLMAGHVSLLLAHTMLFLGDFAQGRGDLENCLANWTAAGHEFGVALAHSSLGWHGWLVGRIAQGIEYSTLAYDYFVETGDDHHRGLAALNLAELHRHKKDLDESISWSQEAIKHLSGGESRLYQAIATYRLGRAQLDRGRPDLAVPLLESALELEESVGEAYSLGLCLLNLAEAYIAVSDPRSAPTLERASANLGACHNAHGQLVGMLWSAMLGRDLDPTVDARETFHRCGALAHESGFHDLESVARMQWALEALRWDPAALVGAEMARSILAACRFSPYLADDMFARYQAAMSPYPEDRRRTTAAELKETLFSHPEILDADRRRRRAEGDPRLGPPMATREFTEWRST